MGGGADIRVSVVIPCYNHARYLPEAVLSVIGQRLRDWEIIIVDDGSTDESAAVAARLVAVYDRYAIRLLRQPNRGVCASRTAGIAVARGVYVLTLDADDVIAPGLLDRAVAVLDARPEVGFVYTDAYAFGGQSSRISGGPFCLATLRLNCQLLPATLFRRCAWAMTEGFRESMRQGYEDWDFWLSLAEVGWVGWYIAEPLVLYRRSGVSRVTAAQRHDLELRARIVLNHPRLYESAFVAWARWVCSPAVSSAGVLRSRGLWWRAFVGYALLVGRYCPALLFKTVFRPLFWRLPIRQQGYARWVARLFAMGRWR